MQEDETVEVGVELAVIGDGATPPAAAPPHAEPEAGRARSRSPSPSRSPSREPEPRARPPQQRRAPEPAAGARAGPGSPRRRRLRAGPQAPAAAAPPSGGGGEAAYVTPLVRKLATEHGVDLGTLQGTGVGGRIRKQDVLDAAGQGQAAPAARSGRARRGAGRRAGTGSRRQLPAQPPSDATSAPAPAYVSQAVEAAPNTTVRGTHRAAVPPAQGHRRSAWSSRCRSPRS